MTKVQLTDTAQNIVNQIISSDTITVCYGPVSLAVSTDNVDMSDEGMIINPNEGDDVGVPLITNHDLNTAKIINGNIEIPITNADFYWTAIISLYKLNKVVAIN